MKVLVTGVAGFIGMHTATALLKAGHEVLGLDNLNDYYSVALKQARLLELEKLPGFRFVHLDISDASGLLALFAATRPDKVIHLAAQAGVRYSIKNPQAYVQSNLVGFANMLEACRHYPVQHLLFASTSSVYGSRTNIPFAEHDNTDAPVSFYAATKKANEAMAHSYAHLYGIPCTGLRFFTVYGPWGRPDMAPWLFTNAILNHQPIRVFNRGALLRDFTEVSDIVDGVIRLLALPPTQEETAASYRLLNIGNHTPIPLLRFIEVLEQAIGIPAIKEMADMQAGDVLATAADTNRLSTLTGFSPSTSLETGLFRFVQWYRTYHGLAG